MGRWVGEGKGGKEKYESPKKLSSTSICDVVEHKEAYVGGGGGERMHTCGGGGAGKKEAIYVGGGKDPNKLSKYIYL